ncbi:hypothetical protein H9P43_005859 [Blastocladiella emersonii ATCC 22665]|nr:hypothetical protein H9P43_005859 [Blastocladiella emersonii ATCC 22665]
MFRFGSLSNSSATASSASLAASTASSASTTTADTAATAAPATVLTNTPCCALDARALRVLVCQETTTGAKLPLFDSVIADPPDPPPPLNSPADAAAGASTTASANSAAAGNSSPGTRSRERKRSFQAGTAAGASPGGSGPGSASHAGSGSPNTAAARLRARNSIGSGKRRGQSPHLEMLAQMMFGAMPLSHKGRSTKLHEIRLPSAASSATAGATSGAHTASTGAGSVTTTAAAAAAGSDAILLTCLFSVSLADVEYLLMTNAPSENGDSVGSAIGAGSGGEHPGSSMTWSHSRPPPDGASTAPSPSAEQQQQRWSYPMGHPGIATPSPPSSSSSTSALHHRRSGSSVAVLPPPQSSPSRTSSPAPSGSLGTTPRSSSPPPPVPPKDDAAPSPPSARHRPTSSVSVSAGPASDSGSSTALSTSVPRSASSTTAAAMSSSAGASASAPSGPTLDRHKMAARRLTRAMYAIGVVFPTDCKVLRDFVLAHLAVWERALARMQVQVARAIQARFVDALVRDVLGVPPAGAAEDAAVGGDAAGVPPQQQQQQQQASSSSASGGGGMRRLFSFGGFNNGSSGSSSPGTETPPPAHASSTPVALPGAPRPPANRRGSTSSTTSRSATTVFGGPSLTAAPLTSSSSSRPASSTTPLGVLVAYALQDALLAAARDMRAHVLALYLAPRVPRPLNPWSTDAVLAAVYVEPALAPAVAAEEAGRSTPNATWPGSRRIVSPVLAAAALEPVPDSPSDGRRRARTEDSSSAASARIAAPLPLVGSRWLVPPPSSVLAAALAAVLPFTHRWLAWAAAGAGINASGGVLPSGELEPDTRVVVVGNPRETAAWVALFAVVLDPRVLDPAPDEEGARDEDVALAPPPLPPQSQPSSPPLLPTPNSLAASSPTAAAESAYPCPVPLPSPAATTAATPPRRRLPAAVALQSRLATHAARYVPALQLQSVPAPLAPHDWLRIRVECAEAALLGAPVAGCSSKSRAAVADARRRTPPRIVVVNPAEGSVRVVQATVEAELDEGDDVEENEGARESGLVRRVSIGDATAAMLATRSSPRGPSSGTAPATPRSAGTRLRTASSTSSMGTHSPHHHLAATSPSAPSASAASAAASITSAAAADGVVVVDGLVPGRARGVATVRHTVAGPVPPMLVAALDRLFVVAAQLPRDAVAAHVQHMLGGIVAAAAEWRVLDPAAFVRDDEDEVEEKGEPEFPSADFFAPPPKVNGLLYSPQAHAQQAPPRLGDADVADLLGCDPADLPLVRAVAEQFDV